MKITFPLLLFTVFLVLKLTNVITWSWWWVTAPLWAGMALFVAIAVPALFALALKRARQQSLR